MKPSSSSSNAPFPRALPPAPAFPGVGAILRASGVSRQHRTVRLALEAALAQVYPKRRVVLFGSGTAALFACFAALKKVSSRRYVLISAYTCPDVAAAAVRAGFQVALVDLVPESVAMNPDALPVAPSDCAAAVLSNLYGLPERLDRWQELADAHGVRLIDDACQAALSADSSGRLGMRAASIGVLSFARGKGYSAAGGGALVLPDDGLDVRSEPDAGSLAAAKELFYGAALGVLSSPRLYWIPLSAPFLGLGQTVYDPDFSLGGRGSPAWLFALARLVTSDELSAELAAGARAMSAALGGESTLLRSAEYPGAEPRLVRYPVCCRDVGAKQRLFRTPHAAMLGISPSYPTTLEDFSGLRPHLVYKDLSAARDIAGRIVTLPVHRYVADADRRRIAEIMAEVR